ncbi:MAG: hypothetical protein JWQ60_2209 [Pseudonocardia sp.]|nr:hypothetical protein [Pseudonocardia sp.]
MTLDTPPDRAPGNGTAAGTGQVRLPVGEAELGLLPGTEQEVPEERDTVGSRIEPHDVCGLQLEEHIAGPEHRFRRRARVESMEEPAERLRRGQQLGGPTPLEFR